MEINKTLLEDELDTVIHLRCYYGPVHAGMSLSPVKNPKTGEYPSCVRNVDSNGNIILGRDDDPLEYYVKITDRFNIKDGTDFDLNNPVDRKKWEAIKFSDLIFDVKGKRDERGNYVVEPYTKTLSDPNEKPSAVAIYRVERVIDETKSRNLKSRRLHQALNYIYNASKDALKIRAMLLGKYIKDAFDEEIEEFMVGVANENPDKIINLFESNDTKYMIAFTYAKQKGIFRTNKGGLITYNDGDIIGRDMDSCITFMKDPKNKLITQRIFEDIQDTSLRYNDVIPESVDTENKRIEDLKNDPRTLVNTNKEDYSQDSQRDSELLQTLNTESTLIVDKPNAKSKK